MISYKFPEYLFLFLMCFGSLGNHVSHSLLCHFYNDTCPENSDCPKVQDCDETETETRFHCYVLWHFNSTTRATNVKLKGCFMNNKACYDKSSKCVEHAEKPSNDLLFCCCGGDYCNQNFTWEPQPPIEKSPNQTSATTQNNSGFTSILIYILVTALILPPLLMLCYFYRQRKLSNFNELPTMEPHPLPQPSPTLGLRSIQLLEIKARGRFGAVWKAQYKSETVAVKVFPPQDRDSWLAEYEVFKLPRMDHEAILRYIGVEKRGDNLQAEFWLITAFHERGSLCDFLKANIVSWSNALRIAESMARGLMHLHEEIPPSKNEGHKPAIAHRDFKSKNVLLRADLSACIADFGLALIFAPGKPCGDTHGQVGTRRYMAPEILEGAINFNRDSFLRIDMYACGLVLWELVSRCTAQEGPIPEYLLPFEEEVGQHPTLEDMQECVVQKKIRPCLRDTWKKHPGLVSLCDTMEECWDHDAEARLSASCVVERVSVQVRLLKDHV